MVVECKLSSRGTWVGVTSIISHLSRVPRPHCLAQCSEALSLPRELKGLR